MCGIAGYWGSGTREILQEMGDSLKHRGPDDDGLIQIGEVGLVHRRLSIVDLTSAGHQPMSNAGGNVSLVFNGEIYNYKELKNKYLSKYTFVGSSDTEVLLHLYEELGQGFLEKIKGMFALALYDRKKDILLLARDPLGKKPLYWAKNDEVFIFGSELKALRKHPNCPPKISRKAIAKYLVYEYIPTPETIYENIYKLHPGSYIIYDGTNVTHGTYHTHKPAEGTYGNDFNHAKSDLFSLLENAVAKRMIADVPIGVFLSGGLDSSAVAYFAQKAVGTQVQTFSIGFEDKSFDEGTYARDVATALGTRHYERTVGPKDLLSVIEAIPQVLDEPTADSSIVPTLLLSEFTSSNVKVALGGDGADEIFYGYDTFFAHQLGKYYEKVPSLIHNGIKSLTNRLPVSHAYMSFDFKAKKFLSGFDTSKNRRNTYWLSAFTPEELPQILNFEIDESVLLTSSDAAYGDEKNFWDNLQIDYLNGYLAEDILTKVDRASMAYGLEVRTPFLDLDLVTYAMRLPHEFKRRGRNGKFILKQTMKGYLPEPIIHRSKKGFNIPVGQWIRHELKDLFTDTLLNGSLVSSGLFKRDGLVTLLESHISGKKDNRKKLWALFVLALWMKKWHE